MDVYKDINYCIRCGNKVYVTKDREGKHRPQCPECGWVFYLNPVPAVAAVVINNYAEVLLVRRSFEPKAGEWALPSGYMETHLTPEENVLQELKEETGLEGGIQHCIGWHYGHSPIYYSILSIGFRIKITGGELCAGDDAEEVKFVKLNQLPHIAFASHREFIRIETGLTS